MDQLGKIRTRTRNGRTTYYLDFRPYGRVWAHRGVPMADEATARQVLRKIQAKVAEGRELSAVLTDYVGDAKPARVNTWVARWLEYMEGQVEDGQRSPTYLAALRSYARDEGPFSWWRGWSVHDVKKPALVAWRDWMLRKREPRLSPKSVQNVLGAFRAFMRWLVDEPEVLQKLPVFPTVEVSEYVPTIITPETQDAILQAIPEEQRGAFLALVTGLRPGDVRALNVADYRDGWFTINKAVKGDAAGAPVGTTKTRRSRRHPVPPELQEWLAQRLRGEDDLSAPLFPNPVARNASRRWSANQLRRVWKDACEAVGVSVRLYEGTKHSTATHLRGEDVPLETLQALLGHKDRRSTERYARLADSALVDALARRRR